MRTSGAIVCSGVIDGTSIVSANVFFALSNSSTNTPADTAFTYDNFPPLNAGNYVWQATKITDSDGKTSLTGKICLGPTTDFLSGTEVYAISTSNSTAPADNQFGTTYNKTKGYYLWTATRVQYTNGAYAYLNKKCVGYWGEDGKSITGANVFYALSTSGTTAPADSSFTYDDFPDTLNSGYYVWEATKVTFSSGNPAFTGKMCLGPTTDFLSGTEVYAISTSNSTAPAENTTNWKTTYEKTKGYYLWTATRVQYTNGNYAYLNKKCVGYWGEDGGKGYSIALTLIRNNLYTDANWNTYAELGHSENYGKRTGDSDFTACRVSDYFVVTGTSSDSGKNHTAIYKCTSVNANSITGTCVSHTKDGEKGDNAQYIYLKGSAFNKDSAGTNVVNSEIRVNGGNNLATRSRGLCLVTLNRQTLAVVDSATIYDTYEGTTGKNNLITKLNSLGDNVLVCLVSYDAIGWSDTLISLLQTFGMSDLPYTDANRYPFLFIGHKNLGKGNGITRMNDMTEPAIPVELGVYVANGALSVKDGEDGDDAVTYQIVFSEAWAKVDRSNSITARLRGYAYKIEGSVRHPLGNATIRLGYILNDPETYADTTTDSNGYFSEDNWFDNDVYGPSGYSKGSQTIFAAIIIDGSVKCAEYVTMVLKGDKGETGRMYYIAGKFPEKAPYTRTAKLCPVVYYSPYWWYLDADSATGIDTPSDSNSSKWKKLENYGVVLTDAIFVKNFAQFGAAIIAGDWLISCHGTIGGVAYGGSVENPDQYNNRAAYTYFDPVFPQGYDPFQLPVTNDEIDRGYNTQWTKITNNFILEAGTYKFKIRCYVNSSDGMHLRLFYGDETGEGYYLQGVTNEEPVTFEIEKTLDSTRNDWNIRAGMNEDGEVGYIVSVEIEPADARFVPNYAVDLKTGRSYQSDAHIKGTITSVGPNTKVVIGDGIMEFFGKFDFPNIVVGVDADGCAILNFYDKSGKFKYGLGPDKIIETLSQAESMKLTYYNVDTGSDDCTALVDSDYVAIYLYTYKNQSPASAKCLYKYLAKISANVYGGNYVNNDDAQGKKFNGKIIKQDYSIPLQDSNIYTGGIVMSSSRVQCGMTSYLSNMLSGTSYEELDYRGYDVMKDSDFNVNKDGYVYRFVTKDQYNPTEAFYIDRSYYNDSVGYSGVYADKYHLNLCTDPEYDDKLIDPIYWFNLICINSEGASLGVKTLYINRSKLKRLLQDAGYSL